VAIPTLMKERPAGGPEKVMVGDLSYEERGAEGARFRGTARQNNSRERQKTGNGQTKKTPADTEKRSKPELEPQLYVAGQTPKSMLPLLT